MSDRPIIRCLVMPSSVPVDFAQPFVVTLEVAAELHATGQWHVLADPADITRFIRWTKEHMRES